MESLDQQFQQQKENYQHMSEGELYALAEKAYDLTEIAREALQAVISDRGITIQLKLDPPEPLRPEDEDLVIFRREPNINETVWTMKALDAVGIPSFLCLEVRAADVKRAHAALERTIDEEFEEDDDDPDEKKDYAILCPKCRSAKVVLDTAQTGPPRDKFWWRCDACRHQWVDNGFVQEAAGGQSWPGEEFPAPSEEWDPK